MSRTALIVDDSPSLRYLLAVTLQQDGFEVVEHDGPVQALLQLRDTPVDIVITDLVMPDMDGIAFVRALRGIDSCRFIPVLLATAAMHDSRKPEAKAAGVTGWIHKPFTPAAVLALVKRLVP